MDHALFTVSLALTEYDDPKWLEMMHWYFPSLAKATLCSLRMVVYSITSPPWARR